MMGKGIALLPNKTDIKQRDEFAQQTVNTPSINIFFSSRAQVFTRKLVDLSLKYRRSFSDFAKSNHCALLTLQNHITNSCAVLDNLSICPYRKSTEIDIVQKTSSSVIVSNSF